MKKTLIALTSAFLAVGTASLASPVVEGEDLFKWGEYDSLIRVLEPATRSGSLSELKTWADSAGSAKSLMFLGVAFFATGESAKADDAFQKACGLDPEVKLDRFYVTEEIANHFQAIAMEGIRRRPRKPAAAAVSTATIDSALGSGHGSGGTRTDRLQPRSAKAWLWWGVGLTAAVAVGGGAVYFAGRDEGENENVTVIDVGH